MSEGIETFFELIGLILSGYNLFKIRKQRETIDKIYCLLWAIFWLM